MRRSPEEQIQRDFEKTATALGQVLVKHYCESSDISGIKQTYVWRDGESDDWDTGGWYLRIEHPNLGEVELKMKE